MRIAVLCFLLVLIAFVCSEAFVDFTPGASEFLATEDVLNLNFKPVESEHVAMAYDSSEDSHSETAAVQNHVQEKTENTQSAPEAQSATTKLSLDEANTSEAKFGIYGEDSTENEESDTPQADENSNDENVDEQTFSFDESNDFDEDLMDTEADEALSNEYDF